MDHPVQTVLGVAGDEGRKWVRVVDLSGRDFG